MEFYTPNEVADLLRIDRSTVTRLIQAGDIDARRIGGQWRIPGSELQRLLSHGTKESA